MLAHSALILQYYNYPFLQPLHVTARKRISLPKRPLS